VDVYKDKAMADLLKIELAKGDPPKPALDDALHDTFDTYVSPLVEDESRRKNPKDEFYDPLKYEIAAGPEAEEPVAADVSGVEPFLFENDDSFYAPARSDYFDTNKKPESRELPEIGDAVFTDDPFSEPEPLDTSPHETISLDESTPESDQPEPVSEDSDIEEEPSLQTAPFSQESSEQRLKLVVKNFRLNFADVAFLFHISLPRAQMWFAGTAMGGEEEMQLQYLFEMAKRVEEMDSPRLDRIIRYPMSDGEFFMEKLKDRKITDENLKTLQETAERSEELRRKFKGATKPFHGMQNAIGLYATPLHCEG